MLKTSINYTLFIKNTVCNMPSYTVTEDEYNALDFGLGHYIPTTINKKYY